MNESRMQSRSLLVRFSLLLFYYYYSIINMNESGRSQKNNNVTRPENAIMVGADARRGAWYPSSHEF
eukprot:scaffold1893_cov220-Amphora_coffeaeformis.AAC.17